MIGQVFDIMIVALTHSMGIIAHQKVFCPASIQAVVICQVMFYESSSYGFVYGYYKLCYTRGQFPSLRCHVILSNQVT